MHICCICGVLDRQVHVWNLEGGEAVATLSGHRGVVKALAVHQTSGGVELLSLDARTHACVPPARTLHTTCAAHH